MKKNHCCGFGGFDSGGTEEWSSKLHWWVSCSWCKGICPLNSSWTT